MFFNFFKKSKQIKPEDQKKLLQIIETIKSTLTLETSIIRSDFESVEKLDEKLDELSEAVKEGKSELLEELTLHFAPTSSFQELSLENGWAEEYLKLADQFDQIYNNYK